MALDLFVNYERYSNHPIFYRTTGTLPLSFKIVDTDPFVSVSNYTISLSVNKQFIATRIQTGEQFYVQTFSTATPKVCAINVSVSNNDGIIGTFAMSAVFVPSFPNADLILYPSNYINQSNLLYVPVNQSNFESSPGVYFYGEGHTEKIMLSCNPSAFSSPNSAVWLVGNEINSSFSTSVYSVSSNPAAKNFAVVSISSVVGQSASYPVSLKVYNDYISPTGPVITYSDVNGAKSFYPFFASTMTVDGIDRSLTTYQTAALSATLYKSKFELNASYIDYSPGRYKGNIKVLEYPLNFGSRFVSPFGSLTATNYIVLPTDRIPKPFRGYLYNPRPESFIFTNSLSTKFELNAVSEDGEWSTETPVFSSIHGYQFGLSYDTEINDGYLPNFCASASQYTTLTLNTSCFKEVQLRLDNAPTDWNPKIVKYNYSTKAICGPLPTVRLYTPNFYYTRDQIVPVSLVGLPAAPFQLKQVLLTSNYSDPLMLTLSALSGTMSFSNVGPVDLTAEMTIFDPSERTDQVVAIAFNNFIEVVNRYDFVDEDLFQTNFTPLKLTYSSQPKLSPNEWAIADNVNSIIKKLYTVIEDLDQYTKLYVDKSKFYAWLGPTDRVSSLSNGGYKQIYIWQDLDPKVSSSSLCKTWKDFENKETVDELTWLFHTQITNQKKQDPTCYQRHCLDWRWKARKKSQGVADVKWKYLKKGKLYEKLWMYEKCPIDIDLLNCNLQSWRVSTMDINYFPIPVNFSVGRCYMHGAIYHERTGNIVYAHAQEVNLLRNNYETETLARKSIADELYPFQDIANVCISSEGRVVTLDTVLCRVSVFDVVPYPAEFKLFTHWGTYGTASNPRGFNKPRDLHVDQNNSVWITDTGNKRIKKLSLVGKHIMTIYNEIFEQFPPLSVCVDSKLQLHCLTNAGVYVFDQYGEYSFMYELSPDIVNPNKINTSYNRESVYITHQYGVVKYFRTGQIAYHPILKLECGDGSILQNFQTITQDLYRNCYVTVNDKVLKICDVQQIQESKAPLPEDLYWPMEDLMVHKEEYIQPWVYLKSFHRLWDNIELIRSSLTYEKTGCKSYTPPVYAKEDLVIGQNEIVTNAVINRLSEQLWTNLYSIVKYFDPECEK